MPRLPIPGSDQGTWGTVLNEFLSTVHNTDGSLKDGIIAEAHLNDAVKDKLNAVGSGGATNLTASANTTTVVIASDTGTDATLSTATSSAAGVLTASDKSKLDGIAAGAQVNAVTSVATRTGAVTLTKADVGLSSVDNTSDTAKPVSTAMQTALDTKAATSHTHSGYATTAHTHSVSDVTTLQTTLDGKEPTITTGTSSQYWRGDKTWQTLDKSSVNLTNVDNTSDVNKPVSSAAQTALNAKAPVADTIKVIVHGSTATTARPTGWASVMWIGSVAPTNAVDDLDTWLDTTGA